MSPSPSLGNSLMLEIKIAPKLETPLKEKDCSIQYGSITDSTKLIQSGVDKKSNFMRLYSVLVTMTIEPIMFCYMFGFIMNASILTNLMMDIGCQQNLNFTEEVCSNLSGHKLEKKEVEILATNYSLYFNLLSLIGAFVMIFIAPWSDKYGRKPPLVCVIVGSLGSDLLFILCTHYNAGLECLLVAKLPMEIFGGFICVLTVIYSHASEVSSEKNRTLKYTLVQLAMGFGTSFGMLIGGFLEFYYGYIYIYITLGVLHVFCFLWVLLVVEETTGLGANVKRAEKMKKLFECRSLEEGIKATFRAREGYKRILIVLLFLSMSVFVLIYESFGSIGFVFVYHLYDWDISKYTIVSTCFSLASMAVTLLCTPIFINVFKMKDFTLGVIGASSVMVKNLFIAFASDKSLKVFYYIGQAAGIFGELSILAIRSVLSKTVEKEELGKVFSFLATCEAIIPMVGTIAMTKLFQVTMDSFPNVAYAMTVVLLVLPVATFLWACTQEL